MIKHHWPDEVISRFPKAIVLTVARFYKPHIDGITNDRHRAWTRNKITRVVNKYNELLMGPVPDTCKSYTYKFLTENADTWIPKSRSITDHPFMPQIRDSKTASFPKWLVISTLWPRFKLMAPLVPMMSVWWGVSFPPTGLFYPPASYYSVERYERLFEGDQMENTQSKDDLFIAHTQQKSEVEVEPGTPSLEKTNDAPSSQPASRNETTGYSAMAPELITETFEPIIEDSASLTDTNSSNSVVDAEPMDTPQNQNSPEPQAVVYYDQLVRDLEKQLDEAKANQQHAQRIAWHKGQAEHHMQQCEYHTRKLTRM